MADVHSRQRVSVCVIYWQYSTNRMLLKPSERMLRRRRNACKKLRAGWRKAGVMWVSHQKLWTRCTWTAQCRLYWRHWPAGWRPREATRFGTCCIVCLWSRFTDRLVGLVVKASASRAEDPWFESRLRRDFCGVESYQWLTNWRSFGYPARHLVL